MLQDKIKHPPIIIIGMHRSGTTMIASILDSMGLFLGAHLEENHESIFFKRHNEWLLRASGGRWDIPNAIVNVFRHKEGYEYAVQYLSLRMQSVLVFDYLGGVNFIRYRSLYKFDRLWGWKDPRTTLTLPIWLDIFPNAKIIHVIRNGVDVSLSLRSRFIKESRTSIEKFKKFKSLLSVKEKRGWFGESPRVSDLIEGFKLWEEYLTLAENNLEGMPSSRLLTISYENFLRKPSFGIRKLSEFAGLSISEEKIASIEDSLNPSRAFHYKKEMCPSDIIEYSRNSLWMKRYGYE